MPSSGFPLDRLMYHIYLTCLPFDSGSTKHLCSPGVPCILARALLAPVLQLRLVASAWNTAVLAFQQTERGAFFEQVEDGVYYPHAWHINTRIRKAVLLSRYRVFHTIASEAGSRGVYLAYDFGANAKGCAGARQVVVKAWVDNSDFECQREVAAYCALSTGTGLGPCKGVPTPVGLPEAQHDPLCDVYALVLPKLGPTLEDLRDRLPGERFDLRMVLVVAIQMIDRYQSIHACGLIHNGIKPANICLVPRGSSDPAEMLYCIDFGFTTELDAESPLPSSHRIDSVGNRRFMSVFAHHGISQSQRDDLESLAYLLSYLFHGHLPWDPPNSTSTMAGPTRSRSLSPEYLKHQHQPHVWRLKTATSASVLFHDMDECFAEFWRDLKGLGYAEVPDYARMRGRFVKCLDEIGSGKGEGEGEPFGWWDVWDRASSSAV